MSTPEQRPDPDALLARLEAEEARETRAQLKIFFGFAPGVGKTYAMLESARRLKAEGVDVVIGAALTHGRPETAKLLEGLEVLPPRKIEYRGHVLEELDLDAALARHPALLILDELAHTNAPGSRHKKRWQDARELLDAGIDVHTTMNVQHVESLNDVVAQITRIQVRETVPDAVLERADEIELVDLSPEDLLERLRQGKVYLGDQAARAAQHFFQRGNLIALRQLALRRTAERVDADVQAYRQEHAIRTTWPTSDRILVCVGPAPASARLVRAARRMAAGLRAPWVAAYVETPGVPLMSDADRERLEAHLRLAESLGASVVRLSGTSISEPILTYARRNNVARIVLGKPTRPRWRDLLRGSVVDEIVRRSGDIDVHVISGDDDPGEVVRPVRAPRAVRDVEWSKLGAAALVVFATTGIGAIADVLFHLPDLDMLYLIAVMIVATSFGRVASVVAAALSVAAYDFFFVSPRYTFSVAEGQYFLSFLMMFAIGLVLSTLTLRLRRQHEDAVQREERTAALYALSGALGSALDLAEVARVTVQHTARAMFGHVVVLAVDARGELVPLASEPPDAELGANELGVAKWVGEHGQLAGLGTDTLPGAKAVCAPLRTSAAPVGVLALVPTRDTNGLGADGRELFEAIARQAALALERAELADKARQAALRAKTEELRSTLLSTVSHDLRTPLATITGAATMLRDREAGLPREVEAEMVESICDEAERLERLVSNLLDMTRLDSGVISVKRDWVPVVELVGDALTRLQGRLGERRVVTTLPDDLPLVSVDPTLMAQLLVNLLENAVKYSPADAPIEIRAARAVGRVIIEVSDRGPGLVPGDEERIFERFYRGANASSRGVGLGLSIARGIARVHGGALTASNRPEGGATFELSLPLLDAPAIAGLEAPA